MSGNLLRDTGVQCRLMNFPVDVGCAWHQALNCSAEGPTLQYCSHVAPAPEPPADSSHVISPGCAQPITRTAPAESLPVFRRPKAPESKVGTLSNLAQPNGSALAGQSSRVTEAPFWPATSCTASSPGRVRPVASTVPAVHSAFHQPAVPEFKVGALSSLAQLHGPAPGRLGLRLPQALPRPTTAGTADHPTASCATDHCAQGHAGDLLINQLGPSQFSEIRLRIIAGVDLYPADMDRPEVRQQQLSSLDWLTGWRIRGGVGSEAQQDRYALYSTDQHLQLRTMRRGWSINELIADIVGVVPRVRSVHLLVDRLDGLPAVQVAVTTREASANQFAVPLDLRGARGRVCTLNLEPGLSADTIVRRIAAECPATHAPQQDFHLALPDNTPLHVLPGHAAWPDFVRGVLGQFPPRPQLQDAVVEDDQVHLMQRSQHSLEPRLCGQPTTRMLNAGPLYRGPVLHPQSCRGHHQGLDKPRMPRSTIQYSIMPPNVVLVRPALTPQVALGSEAMNQVAPPRFYTIFEPRIDLRQRPADASWQLADYVADAVRQLPEPVRMVFVLSTPLPSFATPQLVLTLASAQHRARSLPIDLRRVGGMVHTIEIPLVCSPADIWASLRDKGIDLSGLWEAAHQAGQVRFIDQLGHEVLDWSAEDDKLEWAELTAIAADWQESIITYGSTEASALMARLTSTSTTTAMRPGHETEAPDPPTLLRAIAPADVCVSQSLAGVQILPAHLASQSLSAVSASDLCLFAPTAPAEDGTRPFTVLMPGHPPVVRTAGAGWPMCRYMTEALSVLGLRRQAGTVPSAADAGPTCAAVRCYNHRQPPWHHHPAN